MKTPPRPSDARAKKAALRAQQAADALVQALSDLQVVSTGWNAATALDARRAFGPIHDDVNGLVFTLNAKGN